MSSPCSSRSFWQIYIDDVDTLQTVDPPGSFSDGHVEINWKTLASEAQT